MNVRTLSILLTFSLLSLLNNNRLSAQISAGGTPISFQNDFEKKPNSELKATILPKIDVAQLIKEDKESGRNFRFAAPIDVNYNLNNAGTWTKLENGDRIWRLKIHSKGAVGLAAMYDDFYLPVGSKLYMYGTDQKQVLGAYTSQNNKKSRQFITGIIYGDAAVIEYYEPASVQGQGVISIFKIQHAYDREKVRPPANSQYNTYSGGGSGFGSSLPCHINVNCPQGSDSQDIKRSVVRIRIVVAEGMGWCSGTLINNAESDGKPYVLSAFHCQDGYTPMYNFYCFDFNYEALSCNNPTNEPNAQNIVGATYRSGHRDTDFCLFELSSPVPNNYNPIFAGWNNELTYIPDTTINIHHPAGDIKKISIDYDEATVHPSPINWNNTVQTPANHHYRTYYETGTFEGGSSGSALFDTAGRIVGQLNGGNADCSQFEAFFGRLSLSWNIGNTSSARLKEWLDPNGTGASTVNAYDPNATTNTSTLSVSGSVLTESGKGIQQAKVYLLDEPSGNPLDSTMTDTNGSYSFDISQTAVGFISSLFPGVVNNELYVSIEKNINPDNGITTFDIIEINKVILAQSTFSSPYQYLAADVNDDGNITTFDIILLRQLILGVSNTLPQNSWSFINTNYTFSNPTQPSNGYDPVAAESLQIAFPFTNNPNNLDFIGIKIGDLNDSVDGGL